jgi:hypothetical protein
MVFVLRTADGKNRLLRVIAPLGLFLPSALGLKIDDIDVGRMGFVRYLPAGCVAEVVMEGKVIEQMKTPEEGIGLPYREPGRKMRRRILPLVASSFLAPFLVLGLGGCGVHLGNLATPQRGDANDQPMIRRGSPRGFLQNCWAHLWMRRKTMAGRRATQKAGIFFAPRSSCPKRLRRSGLMPERRLQTQICVISLR